MWKIWQLHYCAQGAHLLPCGGGGLYQPFDLSAGGVVLSAWSIIGYAHSWRGPCTTLWCSSECICGGEVEEHLFYPAGWRGWEIYRLPRTLQSHLWKQYALPCDPIEYIPSPCQYHCQQHHDLSCCQCTAEFWWFSQELFTKISHHNSGPVLKDQRMLKQNCELTAVCDWRLPEYLTTPPDQLTGAAKTGNSESAIDLGEWWW